MKFHQVEEERLRIIEAERDEIARLMEMAAQLPSEAEEEQGETK